MSTKLVFVVSHPVTADVLLAGQLRFLSEHGFDVTVIASPGPELDRVAAREGVRCVAIPIPRQIDPRKDAVALVRLVRALRRVRPDIVNASTPKAGLLGTLAARVVGVRHRIYLLRGLRLETTKGTLHRILGATERITATAATNVVCVSESLRQIVEAGGFVPRGKAVVLGNGSSNGVDVERFSSSTKLRDRGRARLAKHGVTDDDAIVGFVGRLDADKGIADLVRACKAARVRCPRLKLVVIGGDFAGDHNTELATLLRDAQWIVRCGKTDDLPPYYARFDVLAFPSYREGFPNVPLEAAAMGVPCAGYAATGTRDAIVDGVTGTLVKPGDVTGLTNAIGRYVEDAALRRAHGNAAAMRARAEFRRDVVWEQWRAYYERLVR